ncbi:WW domain-binding protein 11 [Schistocerca americana]|uniref:WW domain-binding protein 11 n=1 Tax=Schistocerca americana TaxID=7009 RepID=UPI001F4F17E8|nr:WW domain-binding protein 11 [Schistocerca americana]
MGRRSINTTKSGKYMNPTDQARKEARKKELKKNKKQRQMVRAAVLKGKDPVQLIAEMEKIDQMEYNVLHPPPLNEKVLKDKRKKLKETLERVLTMYDKEDPEKWAELKRMEVEYEKRRAALVAYAESVRHAQQVQVDDIPLPTLQLPSSVHPDSMLFAGIPSQIPLPTADPLVGLIPPHHLSGAAALAGVPLPPGLTLPPPPGILKKTSAYAGTGPPKTKKNPGVPPGPPPELSDDSGDEEPMEQDGDAVVAERAAAEASDKRSRVIRFADDDDDDDENAEGTTDDAAVDKGENNSKEKNDDSQTSGAPKPTSLQQKMLAMAGQDIDQFMKEMEEVHRKREQDRAADLSARLSVLEAEDGGEENSKQGSGAPKADVTGAGALPETAATDTSVPPPTVSENAQQPPPPLGMLPVMFRPPPLRPGMPPPIGIRLPPGPPPGRPGLPPGPPPGLPPRLNLRLPPGPPPGLPPRLLRPPTALPPRMGLPGMAGLPPPTAGQLGAVSVPVSAAPPPGAPPPAVAATPNVLTAAPQLINRAGGAAGAQGGAADPKKPQGATIEAKPQIRNLSADVTRFLPTALRVKREDKKKKEVKGSVVSEPRAEAIVPKPNPATGQQTKDDAYMQFMREMEGLL